MTDDVPDPRFRDQLAEELEKERVTGWWARRLIDNLLPLIAAEVEARVQAAANRRDERAELLRQRMAEAAYRNGWRDGQKAAALASPAPAPRDGNGGEER